MPVGLRFSLGVFGRTFCRTYPMTPGLCDIEGIIASSPSHTHIKKKFFFFQKKKITPFFIGLPSKVVARKELLSIWQTTFFCYN